MQRTAFGGRPCVFYFGSHHRFVSARANALMICGYDLRKTSSFRNHGVLSEMPEFQVVIADFINDELAIENQVLGDIAEVTALDALGETELIGRIETADAIMLYHNLSLTSRTIQRLTQCRLIVRCGAGYDNVDCGLARQQGIPVCNVPDYGTEEVADSAIGLMLSLTRGIHLYSTRMRTRTNPWMYHVAAPLHRLRGQTLGIIGLGRIGMATALRAKSLGMQVAFYDPSKPDGFDKTLGVKRVESLRELLELSEIVSLHCPLNEETRHMINAESLQWMRDGSYLINTARGDCVDVASIPDALKSGRLAGAAIDVLPQEPPRDDSPLLLAWRDPDHPAYERLIINPHAAFYCEEGLEDMRRKGAQACLRALTDKPLRNVVN